MKHFLAPKETRPAWYLYIVSILFVFIGLISFTLTIIPFILSTKGELKKETDINELFNQFNSNQRFVLDLIPFVIGFLLLMYAARFIHKRTFLSFITTRPVLDLKRIVVSFLVWSVITGVLFAIELARHPESYQWNFELKQFAVLVLIAVALVPIQAGFEEVLIRGFVLQLFGRMIKLPIVSVIMSAGIFTLLHVGNTELTTMGLIVLVFYISSGILTSFLTVVDDGLELSWGFHIANNLFALLIVTSEKNSLVTKALFIDRSNSAVEYDVYLECV